MRFLGWLQLRPWLKSMTNHFWLVVSTSLKNISQLGFLCPIYGKKNVPNHQPDFYCIPLKHVFHIDRLHPPWWPAPPHIFRQAPFLPICGTSTPKTTCSGTSMHLFVSSKMAKKWPLAMGISMGSSVSSVMSPKVWRFSHEMGSLTAKTSDRLPNGAWK